MSNQKIHRGKSKIYAHYIDKFAAWSYRLFAGGGDFYKLLLDMVDLKGAKKIADIGCGTGKLLIQIEKTADKQSSLIGIDYSSEMLKIASRKSGRPSFILCDACKLSFESNAIDVCFVVLLLHHLPLSMKIQVLKEVTRVLTPGGVCILMDIDKPTSILGWLIALSRWHVPTIKENVTYGLDYLYSNAGLKSKMHKKKLGLFSYYALTK